MMVVVAFYSTPPDNLSIQEFQSNEAIDVEASRPTTKTFAVFFLALIMTLVSSFCFLSHFYQVVQLISTEILPFANFIPKDFVGQIMAMLNKGSIHSQSASFTGKAAH